MRRETFSYTAIDAQGGRRRGVIECEGEQDAYRKLAASGLTPLKLVHAAERRAMFSFDRMSQADIADLTRELAVLMEAKIPLARGLQSIAEQETKSELKAMLTDIASRIESGSPLTDALEQYRHVFGEVYLETMRAAEKSGNLVSVVAHLAEMLDRQIESSQQLRRAMTYPVIVLGVVALAISVIVVFVIPKFAHTFSTQGVEMPMITRALRTVGESVKSSWYVYAAAFAMIFVGLKAFLSTGSGVVCLERALARTPYVRSILKAGSTAQFARVMSIGLSSGLDMIQSLEMGARATGRVLFVEQCMAMAERLRNGEALTEVLRSCTALPSFARRMLGAGKDSAELSRSCAIVARHFERESSHLTKNINTMIEPLMTVALAVIVLVVALAVFLPMWQMVKIHH